VVEVWWSSWVAAVTPYAVLLRLLIDGHITGAEFEIVFLPLYKGDTTAWPPEIFEVLDGFFADVDDFCADPALRDEVGGIDEPELRRRAAAAFERLSALAD
jgi:self-protective colicin-like immunity protein